MLFGYARVSKGEDQSTAAQQHGDHLMTDRVRQVVALAYLNAD